MASGIYQILNTVNGKVYIGSAKNIKNRWDRHTSSLKRNGRDNTHLQNAYNKYGEDAFEFSIIEYVEDENDLLAREQFYIDSYDWDNLYNIYRVAGSPLGFKHTEETKEKLRNHSKGRAPWNAGKRWSEETKIKISDSLLGEKNPASKMITFNGKTKNMTAWAKELNMTVGALRYRLKNWTLEKALITPHRGY